MGVKLVSASGGSVEINPPATASSFTATMPAGTGNVVVNGINSAIVSATAQASTSGTNIDFTGIPSWVRRITVMFNGVSTSGASEIQIQIGISSGIVSTGYVSTGVTVNTSSATGGSSASTGFVLGSTTSAAAISGHMIITLVGSNVWVSSHTYRQLSTNALFGGGTVTLGGTLDRVRITTVNGTDAFDAGSINILYE
jgi:hypothetical protein